MPTLKFCRICLGKNVKLYKYDHYKLKDYYEQLTALKVNEKDGLPHHFCYECAAMLHKFHKFKEKCYKGQKIIKELMCKGPVTLKSIRNIDRQATNLQSSINIITANYRVRTYVIKSKQTPGVHKTVDPVQINDEAVPVTDDDDVYEDNYHDQEELPPEPELVDVDTKIDNDEEKIDVDDEKINVEKEEIPSAENIDVGKILPDDDNAESDDEKVFLSDLKAPLPVKDEEVIEKEPEVVVEKKKKGTKSRKKKKNQDEEANTKKKQFEITKRKTELDPNNWLKVNLSEEEAIEEFNARGQHKRFLSAEYKCNDCLKGFSKEDMLNRHVKLRHSESVGPIECRFCRMRFKWKCYLTKHMRQHYTKYKCLRCDLVCPLETTALFHEEYHNGVIRTCAHCGEEFKHLTTYYTHLRTHRSEHVCTLCGASFVSTIGLRIHKKIKHINAETGVTQGTEGEDGYCKRCDIKFETKKAFEEHLIHSAMHVDGIEDLELQAPLGSNPRKRRHNLKRLQRRIPTDCHICGKHFSTQAACRKHHLAEHPRTSFYPPNERHICEICGISLAPGSVTSHLNTHTREKSYTCSTCGREFNSKGGLTTHQLTHTSEKPVACTLCDKRFKQLSSMRLHYRTFHLKEPYPKRNRKKKTDDVSKLDDYPHEDSDENMPLDRWR